MRKTKRSLFLLSLISLVWACNTNTTSEYEDTLNSNDEAIKEYFSAQSIENAEPITLGLYKRVVYAAPTEGLSTEEKEKLKVNLNDRIAVYYTIKDLNGRIIGSHNASDGSPVVLRSNTSPGSVVPACIDNAFSGQNIGDSVVVYSAAAYAYNTIEWENNIISNMPVITEVKIVSKVDDSELLKLEDTAIKQYIQTKGWTDVENLMGGVRKITLKEGTGEIPKKGETVAFEYRGTLLGGAEFDSSLDDKGTESKEDDVQKPIVFKLGSGVIQGWNIAIETMHVGEEAVIIIPSSKAYGASGNRIGATFLPAGLRDYLMNKGELNTLPADAVLVFELKFKASREDALLLQ
ncbi:MAG: FKBP-type peptidyl-prolyl cis-trans isomerase [Cytophagales bacterium]|nr:FKBP-type peptidyl-prolyl cis-trans isomerase [Cytophagales bacterium]